MAIRIKCPYKSCHRAGESLQVWEQTDQWNVRQGIDGNTDLVLSVQLYRVISDRNGRSAT